MSTISRRNFLKSTGIVGGSLTVLGSIVPGSLLAGAGVLGLPYYKRGAPFQQDLRRGSGDAFILQGVVYRQDGKTPLADAVVEVWHCNEQGHFDFSNQFIYRGRTLTDKYGRYWLKTNFPGRYKENGHFTMRRIFVLVNGRGHRESFSQLYFDSQRNPYIDNRHWSTCPIGQRPSLPKRTQAGQQSFITYDHYLSGTTLLHIPGPKEVAERRIHIYPNHLGGQRYLSFGQSSPGHVVVRLLHRDRRVVRQQVFKNVKPGTALLIADNSLPEGLYTCAIYSSCLGDFTRKFRV
jgi:protocatechuate 3,4-dioxygenase beta subunit